MAEKYTDKQYYAQFEQNISEIPEDFDGLGYYQRLSMEDMINNFMVAYIGENKILTMAPRHEVAFWLQRGIQEFSYDILHSNNAIELELSPSLTAPLPQDYVNYVQVSWVDAQGNQRVALPNYNVAADAVLQDDEFKYLYDNTGENLYADKSEAIKRIQDPNIFHAQFRAAQEYYGNYYQDDDFSYYYYSYYGRRYGIEPERENINGSYMIDESRGLIYFDYTFASSVGAETNIGDSSGIGFTSGPRVVTLRYISDGLSTGSGGVKDYTQIYVPKMAEDALYAWTLYNLCKLRPSAAQGVPLYKQEAKAKMRNTKLRLSNYKLNELTQIMRGKAKWIKH